MPEINQRIDTAVSLEVDTAAITAIAAIRPTQGNVFLTPETDATVATVTGTHVNSSFIDEFHGSRESRKSPAQILLCKQKTPHDGGAS
jgi:hypothetical protein